MRLLFIWLLLALASAVSASDVHNAVHALESRYHHARTLKAAFLERYSDGNGGSSSESGTVYFSRPGRMRWEYESPEQKVFLVDGKNVWFYVPADRTVSRARLKESSNWRTPLALLTGNAHLSHLCRSIEVAASDSVQRDNRGASSAPPGNTMLRCKPRTNPSGDGDLLREVIFEADAAGRLVRVVIREAGNVETEFRFGNWEENLTIPEATFHFTPPPGVTIVDEATLAGAMH
jgi:outer membrane lipoprotein carrier protein